MKLKITPIFDYLFFIRSKTYNKFFKMRPEITVGCLMGFRLELEDDIGVVYTGDPDDLLYGVIYFASEMDLKNFEDFYGFPFFFKKEKMSILVPTVLNLKDNLLLCDVFIRTNDYKDLYKQNMENIKQFLKEEFDSSKFPK